MRVLCWQSFSGGFWFRVFGFGLGILDRQKHQPLFSERHGYRRFLYIGSWKIQFLTPFKL